MSNLNYWDKFYELSSLEMPEIRTEILAWNQVKTNLTKRWNGKLMLHEEHKFMNTGKRVCIRTNAYANAWTWTIRKCIKTSSIYIINRQTWCGVRSHELRWKTTILNRKCTYICVIEGSLSCSIGAKIKYDTIHLAEMEYATHSACTTQ